MAVLHTCIPLARLATVAALAALVFLYHPLVRPEAQSAGLIAAYSFNEGTGGTVADSSGNNLTGTIVGATWTTGRYGNALSFNGSTSFVDLGNPAALQLTGSMTIEAWINAVGTPPDDGQIVAKSDGAGWQFKTSPDTGPHTFALGVSGTATSLTQRYSTTVRSLGVWYHVAGVYDASAGTLSVYVNGVLDNGALIGTIPTSQIARPVNVFIGRRTGGWYFNGAIDEIRIYNRARTAAEIQADMNTPIGGPSQPDTTPPTVSISAPADGTSVTGTVPVTANASDDVGVAGVQFQLDSVNLGAEVVVPPFTMQWNTSTATLGPHTLSAVVRDFAGNIAFATNIGVTVTSAAAAATGQWSAVRNWPIVAVHAALLPSGSVLAWTDYTTNQGAQLWRPGTNTFVPKTYSAVSLFCSAMGFLPDGRLIAAGGIVGLQDGLGPFDTSLFDPVSETWSAGPFMTVGRYYPSTTALGDGRLLVNGGTSTCGSCVADIPEILDPVAGTWTPLAGTARKAFKYYPHTYQLPDGRVLVAAQDDKAIASLVLDLTTESWSTVDPRVIDGHSSVMYLPGRILKSGTATADNPGHASAATSYTLDMTVASPIWQATGSMALPRSFHNLTVLPDGQVLVTGGATTTDPADRSKAVFEAELWSPVTRTWTTMARSQVARLYHSTALLLPDATVLVAGGGRQNGRSQPDPADEPNAEVFSPPYLFRGARPAIGSAPAVLQYNAPFQVSTPDAARIGRVALIALGAVTHAFNETQRYVPLSFQPAGGALTVLGPIDGNTAPPGPYMLFLVDTDGVPSVAAMVRLPSPADDSQPPSAPGTLSAAGSRGAASLTWLAANDNVGVALYNVHRSTAAGFTPSVATRIAQTAATTFADSGFTAEGTYYYRVTAQDARGNVGLPSNEASALVTLDTTGPSVAVSAPAAGAQVTGTIAVNATATDDVGMAGVQFRLDGQNLGSEVLGAGPTFTTNWNTNAAANGPHTLSAIARDAAGNTAVAANVALTVSNAAPSGLVAAYSFDEGSGTTLTDLSGNNVTGTIVGAAWTAGGRYGSALSFNGSTNYVDLGNPAALQLTGSMTIEAWVRASATPADDGQIVAKSDGNSGWQFKTSPDTGPHTFGVGVSGVSGSLSQRYSSTVRSLNTWYHVAGVFDAAAGTLGVYVNGVLDNGILRGPAVPPLQLAGTVNANIGRRTGGWYFAGLIDEVRIYRRALSQAEIQADMNTPLGTITPVVANVSPNTGPPAGGTAVTIAGSNFAADATVAFGSTAATAVTVSSGTSIAATTPPQTAGPVSVTVTNPDGRSHTLANAFTYGLPPAPAVTGISPGSGSSAGGTPLTVSGANFAAGATLRLGSIAASTVVVVNATTITAVSPQQAVSTVSATVTNPDGQSGTLANAFTYTAPAAPTIAGVSPGSGSTAGGTPVTISGANFATGASVTFGGTAAAAVVVSGSSITATAPAHAAGAVAVVVSNPNGQSATLTSGFTYTTPPAIAFVQVNAATPQSAVATIAVPYLSPQSAGNLNVVVVGWNDTSTTVQSVTDNRGNLYQLAVGPTTGTGRRQSIYYAAGIAGGTTTVTVTLSKVAPFPDVRIAEYRGVSALEAAAGATGAAPTSNSGSIVTTSPNVLLVGANTIAQTTVAAGTGYTRRIITKPNGDILEDRIVTAPGAYNATAVLNGGGAWVMQIVAFK